MGIFDLQMDQNFQILILSNMVKNCMKTVFANKKSPQKPFFMIWGQKKIFEKKYEFCPKKPKKTRFSEISVADFLAGNRQSRPICGRKVRSIPKMSPIFFYRKRTKIRDFISKKHTPSQNGLF